MEVVKTIVGKHVENLFLENVAFKILEFLELTEDQKHKHAMRIMFYETLQAYRLKRNWKVTFNEYKNRWGEHGYFREGEYSDFAEFMYFLYRETSKAQKKNSNVKMKFEKYLENLAFDDEAVYSYGTPVIELNWRNLTARRLGSWSRTTSKHQAFAIRALAGEWGFKEIR